MQFMCFRAWDQLPHSSDALFSQAEKDSLFFSRQWFENLSATAFEHADQCLLLACVVEGDKVLAILPLIKRDNHEWTALGHIYTSLYSLLMVKQDQTQIIDCLARGLSQQPFNRLTLGPIAADDQTIKNLQHAMESSGLSCMRYAQFFNWYHPLQGQTFADYMADRPSRLRNTIARKQRKLEREQGFEIRLYRGDDVSQAMADYHAVYAASWKKEERFEKVMQGFVSGFSSLGWTRLAILYVDEKPVASQIWFVVHKKASIFKLAYDETWKRYSPGSILTQYMMETVIDSDKVEEIDFLTGNDRYKQDWMQHRRQRWRLVITHQPEPEKSAHPFIERIRRGLKTLTRRLQLDQVKGKYTS